MHIRYFGMGSLTTLFESAAKIKLSEPSAYRHLFYKKKAFITTKNKFYLIKLVNKTIK
jgi:hypothetical protein